MKWSIQMGGGGGWGRRGGRGKEIMGAIVSLGQ